MKYLKSSIFHIFEDLFFIKQWQTVEFTKRINI